MPESHVDNNTKYHLMNQLLGHDMADQLHGL